MSIGLAGSSSTACCCVSSSVSVAVVVFVVGVAAWSTPSVISCSISVGVFSGMDWEWSEMLSGGGVSALSLSL